MKIVLLNAVCESGSTGRICLSLSRYLTDRGVESHILYSMGNTSYPYAEKISSDAYIRRQSLRSRVLGNYGFNSRSATKRIIARLEEIGPDIVHLHNIHGHDCHLGMLFDYLTEKRIKTVWTFHDCWAFTAYCPHFVLSGCDRWMTGCERCPQYRRYSFFDRSRYLYKEKRRVLQDAAFTIVTPSHWLKDLAARSFLAGHRIEVIPNGIDLTVFHPRRSDFRKAHHIPPEKRIVLGAAYHWSNAKGLDVFIELAKRLDPARYQIVLVGTDEETESCLPEGIIPIRRTKDAAEMAGVYSASDVFVNPTRADTFPTVNMEALACGTPVVTFRTGGSPETVTETTGIVVEKDAITAMEAAVRTVCEDGAFDRAECVKKAQDFAVEIRQQAYYELYRALSR